MLVAFKTAQDSYPKQGNRELPVALDFTNSGVVQGDLYQEMQHSQIESVQTVYIDNSLNAASLILTFPTTRQVITAQPYSQGLYPVIEPGALRFTAQTVQGIQLLIIFSNVQKNYFTWGAVPGVFIVPPLTNLPINLAPAAIGANVLVAGVALKTIKVYRVLTVQDGDSNLTFDSNATPLTGPFYMFAGGMLPLQPSGIPWFTTAVGENLVLNSSAAVDIGGTLGYVQN